MLKEQVQYGTGAEQKEIAKARLTKQQAALSAVEEELSVERPGKRRLVGAATAGTTAGSGTEKRQRSRNALALRIQVAWRQYQLRQAMAEQRPALLRLVALAALDWNALRSEPAWATMLLHDLGVTERTPAERSTHGSRSYALHGSVERVRRRSVDTLQSPSGDPTPPAETAPLDRRRSHIGPVPPSGSFRRQSSAASVEATVDRVGLHPFYIRSRPRLALRAYCAH